GQVKKLKAEIKNLKEALDFARSEIAGINRLRISESKTLLDLKANDQQSHRHEQKLLNELETLRTELRSNSQILYDYSNALRHARAESDSLQGKIKKGMQDQQNAISHAETLSAEIVALKERTAAADRISHARLEALAAEKEKTQGVIHEAAQLAKKLKE